MSIRPFCGMLVVGVWGLASGPEIVAGKTTASLYPAQLVGRARENIARYPWAADVRRKAVEAAEPWLKMTDEQLWGLMFGNTIERSWMVWSNGHCPACKKSVPMYNWEMDALSRPWKTRCPHCKEVFPKNDFASFYRSGLDEHGIFDAKRADRILLFNAEHKDPNDPLRMFGVDDGNGYVEGDKRWRFIGAYLIYGQWKQAVLGGIRNLAAAYVLTGEPAYAHKAGVLLDRVADLYPTFDYGKEAYTYEQKIATGYVTVWHDACEETRELALAYDQVFEGIRQDKELVTFLGGKAKQYGLDNPKASFADVQRNIEERILRDALKNRPKITSNYPRSEIAVAVILMALDWPNNRGEVNAVIDAMLKQATAVDGVTGEKGLANYSAFVIQALAAFLGELDRADPAFLADLLRRHPRLHETYRFHIDTWCLGKYYPLSGDTGWFAAKIDRYQGMLFQRPATLAPSMFSFLWRLYEQTKDPAFAQVLYLANDRSVEGLPHDLFAADPAGFQRSVADAIAKTGPEPKVGSVNKQQWHIAILRSGQGEHGRAVWLDYDSGGGHSHADGMNLGLFAKGLDLMPDFGYPPVQFGGWGSARAAWYGMTAAHNTVVVDGKNTAAAAGKTTLWADGKRFRAMRMSGAAMVGGKQCERTVGLIDVSDRDFYVLDVFRVVGGTDHAKFMHSHFGTITTTGLTLKPAAEFGHGTQMRSFQIDPAARPGWSADWKVEDRYHLLPAGSEVHLRYTDLTEGAQAGTCEGWVTAGGYNTNEEVWIPRVLVRRQANQAPLASTFVSVLEPYDKASNLGGIRRLPLETASGAQYGEANVAVEVRLRDGASDLFVTADVENSLGRSPAYPKDASLVQKEWSVRLEGEACHVRRDGAGVVRRIALCRGGSVTAGDVTVKVKEGTDFIEIRFDEQGARLDSGKPEDIVEIRIKGNVVRIEGSSAGGNQS